MRFGPPISARPKSAQRNDDWFDNARLLVQVTFYDPDIERLVRRPPGGGGCGSSGSAGC